MFKHNAQTSVIQKWATAWFLALLQPILTLQLPGLPLTPPSQLHLPQTNTLDTVCMTGYNILMKKAILLG